MTFWYLTSDLMFSSRVVAQAERSRHSVVMAAAPTMLIERLALGHEPGVVIIDLSLPGLDVADVVARVRAASPESKIIAYGPHVYAELLAAAQAAGCDAVMSNGEFNRSLSAILA